MARKLIVEQRIAWLEKVDRVSMLSQLLGLSVTGVLTGASSLAGAETVACSVISQQQDRNFHPPAQDEALVECREALSHSTRSVHISLRDPSPPRPRTSSHDHSPPPKRLTLLAAGLAGASSNDHAAAKLSRQLSSRCAALLTSHPCHPSPPPEPFHSPGAGVSLAHGRHLRLKMAYAYTLQLKLDRRA